MASKRSKITIGEKSEKVAEAKSNKVFKADKTDVSAQAATCNGNPSATLINEAERTSSLVKKGLQEEDEVSGPKPRVNSATLKSVVKDIVGEILDELINEESIFMKMQFAWKEWKLPEFVKEESGETVGTSVASIGHSKAEAQGQDDNDNDNSDTDAGTDESHDDEKKEKVHPSTLQAAIKAIVHELVAEECERIGIEVARTLADGGLDGLLHFEQNQPSEIVDEPGLDIFGEPLNKKTNFQASCPVCNRTVGATKFTQHLARCMGIGRGGLSRTARSSSRTTKQSGNDNGNSVTVTSTSAGPSAAPGAITMPAQSAVGKKEESSDIKNATATKPAVVAVSPVVTDTKNAQTGNTAAIANKEAESSDFNAKAKRNAAKKAVLDIFRKPKRGRRN